MAALLSVEGVTKTFGGVAANVDVSFEVGQGEILGLIGPNGAGKTSLFNAVAGDVTPDRGRVLLDGRVVSGLGPVACAQAGIARTFQVVRSFDSMTVRENVMVGAFCRTGRAGAAMAEARAGLASQLEAFAANTMEYLLKERDLLLDGVRLPELRTDLEGPHALIVVRGYDYREDLRALRPYIREYRPVLIGVDGGADALCEVGLTPDLVVGDMDSVSDEVLRCGAEVVVHAYPDGRSPGLSRVLGRA